MRRFDQRAERYINSILEKEKFNKKLLKDYHRFCIANNLALHTRKSYLIALAHFSKYVKKPFKKVTRKGIENYVISLNDYAEKTKQIRKVVVKKFYQWLYKMKKKKYPDCVDWISATLKNSKRNLDILTREEVLNIANATDNLRDKAMILVLYESACRVSEICDLKIKDALFDEYGVVLTVFGKTGERKVRLLKSESAVYILRDWLNNHPYKDNTEKALFASRINNGDIITPDAVEAMLRKIKRKIGMKKRVYPHLFRHTRLTHLTRKGYPEAWLRNFAGWSGSSHMPEVYIHLSMRDQDEMMLKKEGLIESKKTKDKILKPIKCPKCFEINSKTNKFCSKCATPLDDESREKIRKELLMNELLNNIRENHLELWNKLSVVAKQMEERERIEV